MKIVQAYFSRRWILSTILVFLGTAVCIRLGIWQLDRLAQRRLFNEHYLSVFQAGPISLDKYPTVDLSKEEYRQVVVQGKYDSSRNMVLRNQYFEGQPGYFLLTPLVFSDGSAILVERGWIPMEGNGDPENWQKYNINDEVSVQGIIRLGPATAEIGSVSKSDNANEDFAYFWTLINLEGIARQLPYRLIPVFIQPDVSDQHVSPPYPYQPEIEISEGPHLGYAIQWFFFASLLFGGYPFFLKKQFSLNNLDEKTET